MKELTPRKAECGEKVSDIRPNPPCPITDSKFLNKYFVKTEEESLRSFFKKKIKRDRRRIKN